MLKNIADTVKAVSSILQITLLTAVLVTMLWGGWWLYTTGKAMLQPVVRAAEQVQTVGESVKGITEPTRKLFDPDMHAKIAKAAAPGIGKAMMQPLDQYFDMLGKAFEDSFRRGTLKKDWNFPPDAPDPNPGETCDDYLGRLNRWRTANRRDGQ